MKQTLQDKEQIHQMRKEHKTDTNKYNDLLSVTRLLAQCGQDLNIVRTENYRPFKIILTFRS